MAELFSDPVRLGGTTVDANGNFRLVVTVPVGTPPGLHTLQVRTADGSSKAGASITVSPPSLLQVVVQRTGILARTGSNVRGPAVLAFALVLAGFALVGLSWTGRLPDAIAARRMPWPGERRPWR